MGYVSETLPYYPKLRKCSYSVKLIKYNSSLFIHPDRLPRLDTTSAPSGSSMVLSPPLCTVHIQANRPPSPLWLYASSLCILRQSGAPLSPSPPLPLDTPTLRLPHVSTSSLWSVVPLYGGMPSGPWAYPRPPPNSCFHRVTPTAPPLCNFLPGPALFLLSILGTYLSSPTASVLSVDWGRPPSNRFSCMQSYAPIIWMLPTVVRSWRWSVMRPHLPWSSIVGSCAWVVFPIPACTYLTCSGCYWSSLMVLGSWSACT